MSRPCFNHLKCAVIALGIRRLLQAALLSSCWYAVSSFACISEADRRASDTSPAEAELFDGDATETESTTEPDASEDDTGNIEVAAPDTPVADVVPPDAVTDTSIAEIEISDSTLTDTTEIFDAVEPETETLASDAETIDAPCSLPCLNGGLCVGVNTCDCAGTGHNGLQCEVPVCSPSCMHGGTCSAPNTCSCSDTGYSGSLCEMPICTTSCLNGGICVAPNTCDCVGTGHNGAICETPDVPECSPPCLNGGACIAENTCDCSSTGYTGSLCDTPVCILSCMNGGTCSAPNTCSCNGTGYGGSRCDLPVCTETCLNGGSCVSPNTCDCAGTGHTGSRCETAIPPPPPGYIQISAGTFMMGSPSSEVGRANDESQHSVTLTRNFWLKMTEVTQGQWRVLMGTTPSSFASCGDLCPVDSVSWWDAVAYVNALSDSEGLPRCYSLSGCTGTPGDGSYACTAASFVGLGCSGYRLPTEAEWEYAARAGTTTATYNGDISETECVFDAVLNPIAWYCANSASKTQIVAIKDLNSWGLYDMLGSVWEWVHDKYGSYGGSVTNPLGPSIDDYRVARGGSWANGAAAARAATRARTVPGERPNSFGFRPARTIP